MAVADGPMSVSVPSQTLRSPMSVSFRSLAAEPVRLGPPQERFARELIAYHQPDHAKSDQYRTLLGALSEQFSAGQPQALLFTASSSGVGTTHVLLNLAITFARQGKLRVVVVDANMRRAAVAQRLGLHGAPGLKETVARLTPLARAVQETGLTNLLALPAGSLRTGESVPNRDERFSSIIEELREHFDLIMVDTPCWDGQDNVAALAIPCDAVYLVMPQTQSETADAGKFVQSIRERLAQTHCQLRGCILTQATL